MQGDFIFHLPNIIEACTKISLALGRAVHAQAQSKVMIQQKLAHCLKGKEELQPIALTDGPELLFWKEKKSKVTSGRNDCCCPRGPYGHGLSPTFTRGRRSAMLVETCACWCHPCCMLASALADSIRVVYAPPPPTRVLFAFST